MGGFNDKALERIAKYGDGYFGNMEVVDTYLEKLRACGKGPASARIRIRGLFGILTPSQTMEMFNRMLSKALVEHIMMMLPPGLPPAKFTECAQVFAREVIPAFQ
jgi:hypothetical protein